MNRIVFLLLSMTTLHCFGANLIWIGDFQFAFQGNSAAVVNGYDYNDEKLIGDYAGYSNESYVIPSEVVYDGKSFVVDKVGYGCFDDGRVSHFKSSQIKKIKLPETIKYIGAGAFRGTNISSMIIPKSVMTFGVYDGYGTYGPFYENDFLATLIYISPIPPNNWTATTTTYVPDKEAYCQPKFSINNASIVEMITFNQTEFDYSGQVPSTTWTNNVEGYTASLTMPILSGETGSHEEWIPVTFTKDDDSFTTNVVYRYTVKPAQLTIKANDASRQYYVDNPDFGYTCNGFVNGENESVLTTKPSFSTSASKSSNVGTYEIIVSDASSPNYSISYINGTLTITPRTLIASVGNYERLYNEENPEFVVGYDGFVNNENESVLSSKAIASTTAVKTSDVGTYPINVSGGIADNYDFTYTNGVLTINKAEQTISWEQDLSNLKTGDQVELQAVATSGLPITYTMDSNNAAELYSAGNNKTYLDCKEEGQFSIRATQDGNINYYSSARVNKLVTIGNGNTAVHSIKSSTIEIQNISIGIRISGYNDGDLIQVYSPDGVLQNLIKAEGQTTDIPLSKDKVYIIKVGGKTVKYGY